MPGRRDTLRMMGRTLLAALTLAAAAGCSLHRAKVAYDEHRYEESAQAYRMILQKDPTNIRAKIGYQRATTRASEQHLAKAHDAQRRGLEDLVYLEVRKAVVLDPNNAAASEWLAQLELAAQKKKAKLEAEASVEAIQAKADAKPLVQLNPCSLDGVDLNFSTRQSLKEIFKVISKASGVNIITHSSFPQDAQVSVDLRGLTFQRVLDTLMLQNDLQYRVIDTNTILVFKDQQQFKDKFENQLIKTFYLSNAEVETVRDTLTRLIPQIKVFVDKRINAIIIKAKPNDVTTAKRIVNQLDKPKPEVMIYLELLEVTENSLEQVGLLPVLGATDGISGGSGVYRVGATVDNTGSANTSKGGINIKSSDIRYIFPNLALDAMKSSGDARLVASPNVRVVSGDTGEVNIGEKISTTQSSIGLGLSGITGTTGTTTTTSSAASTYGATQTQFSYEDVGVQIKVKPRVHNNTDITLELESTVTTLKSGSVAGRPDLGQRKIKTNARLKDGETAMFGGLLKEEEQKSLQGIWGLTDIPVIGKLFGSTHRQRAKTDVILTVRAVLLRGPELREEDFEAFDPDLATSQEGPFMPPKPKAEPAPAPAPATPAPSPESPKAAAPAPAETPAEPAQGTPQAAAAPAQEASELVVFLSPTASTITTGGRLQMTVLMSGAKGVTSGTIELRVDPKLKLHSAVAGDFLTSEAGTLEQAPAKDGLTRLIFKRGTAAGDSGTLAVLEMEGLAKGNAPVLIQSGRYLVNTNPIPARVVNSLVVVE